MTQYTLKIGLKKYGKEVVEAKAKELWQLNKEETLQPINSKEQNGKMIDVYNRKKRCMY